MQELLNQNSYVLIGIVVLVVGWFVLRRLLRPLKWVVLAGLLVALAVFAASFRTGGDVSNTGEFDQVLASGQPVGLEFYSNF